MTPHEAQELYDKTELAACEELRNYWMEKFEKAGIKFVKEGWYGGFKTDSAFNRYNIRASIAPSKFVGVKVRIECQPSAKMPYTHWYETKVKSDTGFYKLVDRLTYNRFE
jgi:hypothetical protein